MGFGNNLSERLAILFSGLSLVCGIIVYTAPGVADTLLRYLTHSNWQYALRPFNTIEFIGGLILWGVIGYAIGIIFTQLCECGKQKK